jgi:F-type H+-transporting ATPase subunit epsilon
MADRVRLKLVTPSRLLLDQEVDDVTVPGATGELGILPDHITFLTSLEVGEMSFKNGSERVKLALSGGYAEVLDNVLTVLANAAEYANEIDVERAKNAQLKAEKKMEDLDREDKEFTATEAALHRALVRIQVASREARR